MSKTNEKDNYIIWIQSFYFPTELLTIQISTGVLKRHIFKVLWFVLDNILFQIK